MKENRPLDALNGMINKMVNLTLKTGSMYKGRLKAFDIHINLVLEDCKEIGKEKNHNLIFFTGQCVGHCSRCED